jgi:hypothetical protein
MSTPTFAPEGKNRAFGFFDKVGCRCNKVCIGLLSAVFRTLIDPQFTYMVSINQSLPQFPAGLL